MVSASLTYSPCKQETRSFFTGEVAPKEKLNSSDPVDCRLVVVSPKMEQPFSAGDMLVPKNPAPFLLSPDTGGPKR